MREALGAERAALTAAAPDRRHLYALDPGGRLRIAHPAAQRAPRGTARAPLPWRGRDARDGRVGVRAGGRAAITGSIAGSIPGSIPAAASAVGRRGSEGAH